MKTRTIEVYSFNELSEKAKQNAVDNYGTDECEFIFDEAHSSFKKFANIFGLDRYKIDYLEPYRNNYRMSFDDNILDLKGWRLSTYILNNYGNKIIKGKYYGKLVYDVPVSKEHPIGARHVKRYSKIFKDRHCVLTGVCYDDSLLKPIYDFLDHPNNNDNIESLIDECIKSLCNDVENEYEARNSFEGITETIEANEYEFDVNGNLI